MRCRISEHNAWTAKETLGDLNRVALQYFTVSKGLCLISIEALGQYGWGRAFTSIIRQTQFHRLKDLKPSACNLGPNTYAERLQICTYTTYIPNVVLCNLQRCYTHFWQSPQWVLCDRRKSERQRLPSHRGRRDISACSSRHLPSWLLTNWSKFGVIPLTKCRNLQKNRVWALRSFLVLDKT